MTDKVQKIRKEVERLYNQSLADENRQADKGLECAANVSYGKSKACKELLSFIDSMQEECNITGIKSRHATGKLKECIDNQTEEGLEQARKQLEENPQECMYARDNYTDEDRKVLCDGCKEECEYALKKKPVSEDFESALEKKVHEAQDWTYIEEEGGECPLNEEFGADDLEEFARWGANWQKQQMMKDAADGVITFDYYKDDKAYGCVAHDSFCLEERGLRDCDKVKIIVVKED